MLYQGHASVAPPVAADRHFAAAVHPAPRVVPPRPRWMDRAWSRGAAPLMRRSAVLPFCEIAPAPRCLAGAFCYRSGPLPARASFAPDPVIAASPAAAVRPTAAVDRRSGAAMRHARPAVLRSCRAGWGGGCRHRLLRLLARHIIVRALRILLLQFAGLALQIGDLAPQGVTRRLQFRDGGGRRRGRSCRARGRQRSRARRHATNDGEGLVGQIGP